MKTSSALLYVLCPLPLTLAQLSHNFLDNDWDNVDMRKAFFLQLAAEKQFDPFKPENWYNLTKAEAVKKKVMLYTL